jgi:hypothetical protein
MTFQELYYESIMYEEYKLAYKILHLQKRGIIGFADPYDSTKFNEIDSTLLQEEYKQNEMGFIRYRAYALKVDELFYFIIAENALSAKLFAKNTLEIEFTKCFEYDLDTSIFMNNSFMTFREIKNTTEKLPVLVGIYEKDDLYGNGAK